MRKTVLLALFILSLSVFVFANSQNIPWVSFPKADQSLAQAVPNPNPTPSQPKDTSMLLVPWDASFILALGPNDDYYTDQIIFPFDFSLYGTVYNACWINNNGNVTFDAGYSSFTPWGFPINGSPMLAPFFGDVDTRGTGSLWYKIESNRLIVIWDAVGYFSSATDRLNTFELIFTDGTDGTIGVGNTVAFSYGDMAWTTGSASGGSGGLGGTAATVGINKGDGATYAQIGRFDHEGADYDGAYDNNDGIDWLDNIDLFFNTTGGGGGGVLIINPTSVDDATGNGYPAGTNPGDPGLAGYVASYPGPGTQTIVLPVGPGLWRGWAWYNLQWNQADVFPLNGPGDLVWSNVPFGAKSDVPILIVNDNTLPVELSSFTATLTASYFVKLSWVSQSETGLLGYRVYRNSSNNQATAMMITPTMVPATNTSTTQTYSITDNEVNIGSSYWYWLESVDYGTSQFHGPVSVIVEGEVPPVVPNQTAMRNAYPNPFKVDGSTTIVVDVKADDSGSVTIYNVLGQAVKTYNVLPGTNNIIWNGRDNLGNVCGSGIYFYKLSTPTTNQTRKMVIVK